MEMILGGIFAVLLLTFVLVPIQVYEWLGPWWAGLLVLTIFLAVKGLRRRRRVKSAQSFGKR